MPARIPLSSHNVEFATVLTLKLFWFSCYLLKAIYSSAFSLFYSFLAQLEILVKITVRVTRKQDISRHRKNKVTKDPACILKFIKMQ